MTVKVTMTFFLDEDNDTEISQTLNEFYKGNKKEMFASGGTNNNILVLTSAKSGLVF